MLCEVEGIVFKRQKYKEADVLAKILTKEKGLITLNVRGALRPKSKLNVATLNFSYGHYVIQTRGKGISNLRTFKQLKQFEQLFLDVTKNAYASFILDLVDHAFLEYQGIGAYYELILTSLKAIEAGKDPEIIAQLVQLKLLKAYGVAPELRHCLICGKTQGTFDYSINLGGIFCSAHFAAYPMRLHLSSRAVSLIRTLGLLPIEKLGRITVSRETKKQTRQAIDRIYATTVDLNLKTKKFLDELQRF